MPTPVATAPISKTLSSLFASLLMAALRVWPRVAASASTPLTITEALALEEQFRTSSKRSAWAKVQTRLPRARPCAAAQAVSSSWPAWTARRAPTTDARQGRALHASLIPHRPLPWASACSSPSRGATGACLPGSPADKNAKLLDYAGFHAVVAGDKGWRPRMLSRQAGERRLSLEDVLAGRLPAPEGGEEGGLASPVEAASLKNLRLLIDKVRSKQKAYRLAWPSPSRPSWRQRRLLRYRPRLPRLRRSRLRMHPRPWPTRIPVRRMTSFPSRTGERCSPRTRRLGRISCQRPGKTSVPRGRAPLHCIPHGDGRKRGIPLSGKSAEHATKFPDPPSSSAAQQPS